MSASAPEQPVPERFPSPLELVPHPLARTAALDLQTRLQSIKPSEHNFFSADGGKMFGVLVCQADCSTSAKGYNSDDTPTYLAAFSGMLAGQWNRFGFAPPVFDLLQRQQMLEHGEAELQQIKNQIDALLHSPEYVSACQRVSQLRRQQSQQLDEARLRMQQRRELRHKLRLQQAQSQHSQVRAPIKRDGTGGELALQSQRDKSEYKQLKQQLAAQLKMAQAVVDQLEHEPGTLKQRRKALSRDLQQQLFSGYQLKSYSGLCKPVTEFFKKSLPPGGTGDCASIKLLQWCYHQNLTPLCMAEFWWGASPPGGIRHHRQFYPACRGKCMPVLPHMLNGLSVDKPTYELVSSFPAAEPVTLFEDEHIVVVVKPSGMLSVPGKNITDSVENRLQSRYPGLVPNQLSRLLLHRLDQATSGLMLAAKNAACHKNLHQQFERREINKTYIAVVNGHIASDSGTVALPLRVDVDDRPRQMVCYAHGKPAETVYRVLSRTGNQSRLQLTPVTGRTHQLRVHLAHTKGLNTPIVGDELYGKTADRLHLHAERLRFTHPATGESLEFYAPAPF